MRIMIKGGVWKNTEDEILKAAVMKYGKNQWARISSLLVRKSAKQCKARWYEWLDPSIKKTEWSREEEEKLLHLAKIMPNQWRTIAPMVGRTASQCLEHYEKLLDAAQNKESLDPADDPRRLRPGEIDPNPEAKPARPDPVDMDEDEVEMLGEARARLANTKGKKAKRKAREKQLEEARRLAALQKRREMKAAGIEMPKLKRKVQGIDYGTEIPFQKQAPIGFYEVDFQSEKDELKQPFKSIDLDKLKRKRMNEPDNQKKKPRKDDKKKPDPITQVNQLNSDTTKSRSKLMLPEPQISDEQFEELAKESDEIMEEGQSFTRTLLPSSGAPTPARTPARTPLAMRTPSRDDQLRKEAENLAALTSSQTPLVGGDNPSLHPSDFTGVTPRSQEIKTPNALTTPARGAKGEFMTPGRTPLRDLLSGKEEVAQAKFKNTAVTSQLRSALKNLPAPQNEYKIMLPELPAEEQDEREESMEEDASDILRRQQQAESEKEQIKMKKRSSALKKGLPRPPYISQPFGDFKSKNEIPDLKAAEELLRQEMITLITYEAVEYPFRGSKFRESSLVDPGYDELSLDDLDKARKLLEVEVENFKKQYYPNGFTHDEFQEAWNNCYEEEVYIPSQKKTGRFATLQKNQIVEILSSEFDNIKSSMEKEAQKCQKIEKKLGILHAGYYKRASSLVDGVKSLIAQIDQSEMELECFKQLHVFEVQAIPKRIESWKELVSNQQEFENDRLLRRDFLDLLI